MSFFKKALGIATGGVSDILSGVGGGSGGGGSSTSTNVTSDAQIGASEQGQATQGGVAANNGAIVLGDNAKLTLGGEYNAGTGVLTLTTQAPQNDLSSNYTDSISALAQRLSLADSQPGITQKSHDQPGLRACHPVALAKEF